ncbi:DUF3301 domain-containing protein [Vibrio profundum]|uniref:DUF3301 domain-containing protein n=1 Tax=Vibrio profundum TaxID=2910247 RepID=UPI003D14780A
MLSNLFIMLGIIVIGGVFLKQRRQSEVAKRLIAVKCQQLDVQLISVALNRHQFRDANGKFVWNTSYQFEFSSLGDDCYQGELILQGNRAVTFNVPLHRV